MQPDRHLIIDGYNVVHALEAYAQYLPASVDLACSALIEQVRVIHDVEGVTTTLVFDGNGNTVDIQKPGNQPGFSVVYSPRDVSADGIIEQIVRKSSDPPNVTVASRDNMIAESVRSAGAVCITPVDLLDWVARCEQRQRQQLDTRRKRQKKIGKQDSPWNALDGL